MLSIEFLVTSLSVVLVPGTGVIYTVSTGLFRGRKASVFAALQCTAGIASSHMDSANRRRVQAWLRRGFAAAFGGLGTSLAFTEK